MAVALITGVAGFVGSHLAGRLLEAGVTVRGIDNFDSYYAREIKEANLAPLREQQAFQWCPGDLNEVPLVALLEDVDWIYHLAARPGVRRSWGEEFAGYVRANLLATQRLLEAAREQPLRKLVYASSSSVYGEHLGEDASEAAPRRPISPYGVTKLACEGLVQAYHANFGLPSIGLRYFTVYGPRQRPDMAFHRFLRAILQGEEIEIYGDGRQSRDFTFVGDAVAATIQAANSSAVGGIYNIGGGSPATVMEVVAAMEEITGQRVRMRFSSTQPGDPRATLADTRRAARDLGYAPATSLRAGLVRMADWMRAFLAERSLTGTDHEGN